MDKGIYSQQTELFGSAIHQTTCITGKGAPTPYIQGAVGCLYMDEDNYKTYKCVSTKDGQCVWEPVGLGGGSTAIKNTAIGDVIWLTDSAEAPLQSMKIYGKTIQSGIPAPDAPAELTNIGDGGSTTVYVAENNLFNNDTSLMKDLLVPDDTNYLYSVHGYGPFSLPIGPYTLSWEWLGGEAFDSEFGMYKCNIVGLVVNALGAYKTSFTQGTFTIAAGDKFYVYDLYNLYGQNSAEQTAAFMKEFQIQLVAGSVAKPYEPYSAQAYTIPTPNGLPGIPVSSGGNYTDGNGQQYVCGEVDCKKGVQKQHAYELILTGNEDIEEFGRLGATEVDMKVNPPIVPPSTESPCLCTHYVTGTMNQVWDCTVRDIICAYNNAIHIQTSGFVSVDEFKTWLKRQYETGTPVKIVYILDEPIETPLTEEEIQAYKALHTNYPNTTIYNSDGSGLEVEYIADMQHYIDDKIAELAAAIITE